MSKPSYDELEAQLTHERKMNEGRTRIIHDLLQERFDEKEYRPVEKVEIGINAYDMYNEKGKLLHQRMVDEILGQVPRDYLLTLVSEKGGDVIYRYHEDLGVYKPDGNPWIESLVKKILGEIVKPGDISAVVKLAQVSTYIFESAEDVFDIEKDYMVVENGVLNVFSRELSPFSPDYRALSRIPVKYDPEAKCPKTLVFINQTCPQEIDSIQEWTGYFLYKGYPYQKCVMPIGIGANGKSTLFRVWEKFLGKENVSNASLYQLTSDRFAKADLFGKLANIAPDISDDELKRTGDFKGLTGGDRMRAQKKHQNAFYFYNNAKLCFSANKLPISPDQSLAFFRRWMIWEFKNIFNEESGNCDPQIIDKLTTPEELSGLLNWALEGLERLFKQEGFSKSDTAEEIRIKYQRMADPITAFIEFCLVEEPTGQEEKDHVFAAYNHFCKNNGYVAVSTGSLTSELKGRIFPLDMFRYSKGSPRPYGWKGITLRCKEGREECNSCKLHIPPACPEGKESCESCPTRPTCPTSYNFISYQKKLGKFLKQSIGTLDILDKLDKNTSLKEDERGKLRKNLKILIDIFAGYPQTVFKVDTIYELLMDVHGIEQDEGLRLLEILSRDGMIFSPRPGTYKRAT